MLTTVTAGSVLASGQLSIKFDLVELTTGRIFCIALANAFVSVIIILSPVCDSYPKHLAIHSQTC